MLKKDANTALMSDESIASALGAVRERLAKIERERAELERTSAVTREEERLLDRLLSLRRGGVRSFEVTAASVATSDTSLTFAVPEVLALGKSKHPVVQAIVDELAAAGRPVHISDLMRNLRDRSVRIPGSGTQANLISYLRRDSRLVRPSRGMYGLAVWGLENMPTTKGRRRKRRMRVKADDGRGET